jgi:hypothetical protein
MYIDLENAPHHNRELAKSQARAGVMTAAELKNRQ